MFSLPGQGKNRKGEEMRSFLLALLNGGAGADG